MRLWHYVLFTKPKLKAMTKVKFDPTNPSALRIAINYEGVIQASYIYTLWEADSNVIVERHEGNNLNPDDDKYKLPQPNIQNNGRVIEVRSSFVGLDKDNYSDYKIEIGFFQGAEKIGSGEEAGRVTGQIQQSIIFLILTT